MSEWKETTLSDICSDISYGYTASANVDTVGPKFLRITDIVPDRINWNTVPYCEADELNIEKYKLQEGDIVIARTGATTGYNKIIKNIGFDVVFASYLIRYKIDINMAYPYYIGHILQSSNWYNYVDAIAGGSAQPGANAKQLGSFEILLPPLPEQRAIASVLSSLDDKIDLLHRQNTTLEAMAETLFRQWFVEGADEGWEEGKLGNCASVTTGKGLKRHEFIDNGMYPVLGANGEIGRTNNYLTDDRLILTGRVGTLGKVIISDDKVWISDNVLIVKPNKIKYFYPIYFILKRTEFENLNVGSTQPLVTQTDLKNINFILPHNYILENFENNCLIYYEKKSKNDTQIRTLEKLRDTLLPKLMSGEVRVQLAQREAAI